MQPVSLPHLIDVSRLYLREHRLEFAETMYEYIDRDREHSSKWGFIASRFDAMPIAFAQL